MCRKYVVDDALLCMDRMTYGGGRASGSSPPEETGTGPAIRGHLTRRCRDSVRPQIRFRATDV